MAKPTHKPSGVPNRRVWLVWTPYWQQVPSVVFDTLVEARAYAKTKAEEAPGLAWYVMATVSKFEAAESLAVETTL